MRMANDILYAGSAALTFLWLGQKQKVIIILIVSFNCRTVVVPLSFHACSPSRDVT